MVNCDAVYKATKSYDAGTVVKPGQEIRKAWVVQNTGTEAWPAGTRLTFTGGFGGKHIPEGDDVTEETSFLVSPCAPDETATVVAELVAPNKEGRFLSFWVLLTPTGESFGDRLYLDITVRKH